MHSISKQARTAPLYRKPQLFNWAIRKFGVVILLILIVAALFFVRPQGETLETIQILKDALAQERGFSGRLNKNLYKNFVLPQEDMLSQLKDGVRYIVSMNFGGHANQFIGIENLLLLGKHTNRVVILPALNPLHFTGPYMPVSRFFDLDYFYSKTNIPFLEQIDLAPPAHPPNTPAENLPSTIGCWSPHERTTRGININDGNLRGWNIAVDYWPIPEMKTANDFWLIWFMELVRFDLIPEEKRQWLERCATDFLPQIEEGEMGYVAGGGQINQKKEFQRAKVQPDEQLLCFDSTFFIGGHRFPPNQNAEYYESQQWEEVGQYLHFSEELEQVVDVYLEKILGRYNGEIITVHIRRGDFEQARGLAGPEKYIQAVDKIRERLQELEYDLSPRSRKNPKTFPVVFATDEKESSEFVQTLVKKGWLLLNHKELGTHQRFGEEGAWYAMMVDQAILARGKGFVGTKHSTYSMLAGSRIKSWNDGIEEWVIPTF